MNKTHSKNNVDVLDLLNKLQVENITDMGDEVVFSCPFEGHAHGDQNPSFSMNKETTACICFGCSFKGNATTFLAKFLQISNAKAFKFLHEVYAETYIPPKTTLVDEFDKYLEDNKLASEQTYIDEHLFNEIYQPITIYTNVNALNYLEETRKFDMNVIDEFNIRCNSTHIAIPILDRNGIVGVKGRAIDPNFKPKYLVLGKKECHQRYQVNDILFNLQNQDFNSDLIIVEGELNAVAMHQLGYPNTVAFGGTALGEKQVQDLLDVAKSVTIMFDSDKAGIAGANNLIDIIWDKVQTYNIEENHSDPADIIANSSQLKDAQEAVKELLQNKIDITERKTWV